MTDPTSSKEIRDGSLQERESQTSNGLVKHSISPTPEEVKFERKTMRFIDWRMLPLLVLIYAFALIDRINIGAAYTAGMGVDLNLGVGGRFSIVTCLYFVPYILLQLPGNLILMKLGARVWMTFIVIGWGAVQLGMGFVEQWGYLVLCRVLLGAFEASFFPSLVYIISTWYKRYEVQKRLAFFYLVSITISGFSPILAYVINLLDGKRGIKGWQWIFIIEGAITLLLGILCFFFVSDVPHKNTFLTSEQTEFVLKRIEEDRGDARPDKPNCRKILHHLADWTLWAYGVMFMCATLPTYSQAYFISMILRGMGYSTAKALLLSSPPYITALIIALVFAWLSDKYKHRSGFIAFQAIVCMIGLILIAFTKANPVRYLGIFLTHAGNAGTIPGILAYGANNVVSHSKRSVQTALTISFGGIGGILASTTYRQKDYPKYLPGLGVTIGSQVLILILLAVTTTHFIRKNAQMRSGKLEQPLEGQPGFFYTL